jgi:hypothetical protein
MAINCTEFSLFFIGSQLFEWEDYKKFALYLTREKVEVRIRRPDAP